MSLIQTLKSLINRPEVDPLTEFARQHFTTLLKSSNAKKTVSFLLRGARSLRTRGLSLETLQGIPSLQAEIEDWPFPPVTETTSRFQLVVSTWYEGEEQRSTADVTIPATPESIPGSLHFPLPDRVIITKLDFLAHPDPAKPLLYHFSKQKLHYQAQVLEISRRSFRFRLPVEIEVSEDGELSGEGYFEIDGEQTMPIVSWWKRVGKMLIEAEIETIKPKHLTWLIEYLRERFFAQSMVWDGMHVAESLLDEDSPGVRMKPVKSLNNCKALWISSHPPFLDWFPGIVETPSKWQNRNPEAIALEYDAVIGTSDELKEWLTLEPPVVFLENCAVLEIVDQSAPIYPHTIESIPLNRPEPLDWRALFGWNGRYGEPSGMPVYLYGGSRFEHYRYAREFSSLDVTLQWLKKPKFPSLKSHILFLPQQLAVAKKLLDQTPTLSIKHDLWVIGDGSFPWLALDIQPTGTLSDWIRSHNNPDNIDLRQPIVDK